MERANKQVDQYRLTQAFSTFKPGEPLAVTKQRMDIAKGFKDTSEEGNDLRMLGMINQSENPMEFFYHFDDGFHTPADKQPKHPSFQLNDVTQQAQALAYYGDQKKEGDMPLSISDQVLDIAGARKKKLAERLAE
jgi:hypothetical protein